MTRPDPQLGPAILGGTELDDQLEVGMIAGWVAGGRERLDLAQERPDDVDKTRKHDASEVDAFALGIDFQANSAKRAELAGVQRFAQHRHARDEAAAEGQGR